MSKTAAITGGVGDIIYSLKIMPLLNITKLYIKENYYPDGSSMYSVLKRLVEMQGIECLPTSGAYPAFEYEPGLQFDSDLDQARKQPQRGINHIIISYLNHYRLSVQGWRIPWIKIEGERVMQGKYSLIHLTPRWRDNSKVDWQQVYSRIEGKVFFIGLQQEHEDFENRYGEIEWLQTADMLDMAILIRDCEALYCNQSCSVALAQGMGTNYYLERKPGKTNVLIGGKNEHLL